MWGIRVCCVLLGLSSVAAQADVLGSFKGARLLPGFVDPYLNSQVAKSQIPKGPEKFYPTRDQVDRRTPSQILAEYLLDDEIRPGHRRFNEDRANQFIAQVKDLQQNAFLSFCSKKLPKKISKDHGFCKDLKWTGLSQQEREEKSPLNKFLKKWLKTASYRVYEFAIQQMKQAGEMAKGNQAKSCFPPSCSTLFDDLNRPESQPFVEAFFSAIEASQLGVGEDPYWGTSTSKTIYYLRIAKTFVKNWELSDTGTRAANLLVPDELVKRFPNQVFLSPEQVVQLEKEGFDTSTLNPPDSGLWRAPREALANWDARTYNRQGIAALKQKLSDQEIEDFLDPDRVIDVEVLKVKRGKGTSPKLPVQFGKSNQHWKMKFLTDKLAADSSMNPATQMMRLLLAGEVNVISAANNLAAMVGFTVDPTYFKRRVHLYLPEGDYEEAKFKEALEEKVIAPLRETANESWNLRSAFDSIGVDSRGRHFVEMKGVSFQKKTDSESDSNVGSFIRHGLGKEFKREFRALALFSVLIQDLDVKDGNLKAKLVKAPGDPSGEDRLAFASVDFGGTFGFGFPNIYFPDLVKQEVRDPSGKLLQIKLKHHSLFPMPIFKSITFSDAKWLLRQVNQIPENKIVDAFLSGGFPAPIAIYYKDLFLRRLEQLASALGLNGQVYIGADHQLHEFSKRSLMRDPKTYTVAGFENFFKNGKLSDPDNQLFNPSQDAYPRDWGTGLSKDIEGHHKREFYKLVKKGIPLGVGNLVQSAMLNNFQFATTQFGSNGVAFPFCRNRCFFSGFKAGIDWFIPMRFVFENPTESKIEHPYWVIDMFRLTVVLGYGSGDILQKLGASIQEQVLGLGGEFALGMDFIKIRPVKDYSTALGHLNNNNEATRKFFFRDINEQILKGMQEGDILVGTTHLGARGSLLMEPPVLNRGPLKPGLELGMEAFVANRTYTLKGAEDHVLVNWANLKTINVFADAYIRILFPRLPILEAEYKASVQNNQVYDFNFRDESAKATLLAHINDMSPKKVDPRYRYQSKTVKYGSVRAMVNLFEVRKWSALLKRGHVTGEDFKTGRKVDELAYERVNSTRVLRAWSFFDRDFNTVRAQMDPKGDLFLKLDSHFYLNQAYKKDFVQFLKDYQSILPEDLVVFDPMQVKSYLGDFDAKASVVLDAEAIESLFGSHGPSNDAICQEYAQANHHEPAGAWCQGVLNRPVVQREKVVLKRFLSHFEKTRKLYRGLIQQGKSLEFERAGVRMAAYSLLRSMVFTFSVSGLPKSILDHLHKWVGNQNLFRTATLTSFLDGFPGQQEKVEISSKYKGKLELVGRYKTLQLEDSFKIFTDDIDRELRRRGLLDRTSIHYLR